MHSARISWLLPASVALLGCHDATRPADRDPPPALTRTVVDSVGIGAHLSIAAETTAVVRVRYAPVDGVADSLEVVSKVTPDGSTVTLTRLQLGHTYQYSASALSASGEAGPPTIGQFTTPPLPADLAGLRATITGRATNDILILECLGTATGFTGFVALDQHGAVVWYFRTKGGAQGATLRANGNFVLLDPVKGLREVTPDGDVVHQLDNDVSNLMLHHDVVATPANTVIFLAKDMGTGPLGRPLFGEAIYEWTPETGALQKRWTARDFLDPTTDWGKYSRSFDWLHANSLAIGPHGNVLISLNWLDQVVSISPDWSRLEWRLGGLHGDFAIDADAAFSGQHTASMTAEGRVLLFDNGRNRADGSQYSRGLELAIDTVAHQANRVWDFRPSTDIFAPYISLASRLPNGNTTVFFGTPAGQFNDMIATGPISAFEVTAAGATVWHVVLEATGSIYRGWTVPSLGGETRAHGMQ